MSKQRQSLASSGRRVTSINIATSTAELEIGGEIVRTGIFKTPITGRVSLADDRVGDDVQANRSVHGGRDKAAYAYAVEDYEWWAAKLDRDLHPGSFGENLTLEGVEVGAAEIGERWRIGTAVLEVSEPREPCTKLAHKLGIPGFVRTFARALRPGAYLRIVEEGEIGAGDRVDVIHRPGHGITVTTLAQARFEPRLRPSILAAEALSAPWREWAESA